MVSQLYNVVREVFPGYVISGTLHGWARDWLALGILKIQMADKNCIDIVVGLCLYHRKKLQTHQITRYKQAFSARRKINSGEHLTDTLFEYEWNDVPYFIGIL